MASAKAPSLTVESIVAAAEGKSIPLPTLYSINLSRGGQPLSPKSSIKADETLQWELEQLHKKRTALPPTTYMRIIKDTFSKPAMGDINPMQALKALDYLRDLEDRRISMREKSLTAVQQAIDTFQLQPQDVRTLPYVQEWIGQVRKAEDRCSKMYASLFLDLRRWIIFKEINAEAFNKQSSLAMVNTLFSNILTASPPSRVPLEMMEWNRDSWTRMIAFIAGSKASRKQSESSDYPRIIAVLEQYLDLANQMIEYCAKIDSVEQAERDIKNELDNREADLQKKAQEEKIRAEKIEKIYGEEEARKYYNSEMERYTTYGEATRQGRKVDSGVSFASNTSSALKRPSTSDSSNSTAASTTASTLDKAAYGHSHTSSQDSGRGPSLFRVDTEMSKSDKMSFMRKMKSFGDLSHLKNRNGSVVSFAASRQNSDVEFFDVDAMKQQREAWEAKQATTKPGILDDHSIFTDVASIRGNDDHNTKHKIFSSLRRKKAH
ncbi:hypothetical protein K490DRAFT_70049 [Saccharata proteae CBS 121410]|uniref:Uncharacterized protein n=1 Tax=Saccharata proteae CBS 121410 TaxID=1314787 RepID=A0A9P4HKF5_9PEZI|nr:hypothetical protein K490DRAFT_70049 [Saccharata proteae CBS 121410]